MMDIFVTYCEWVGRGLISLLGGIAFFLVFVLVTLALPFAVLGWVFGKVFELDVDGV